jgi:hypothetical protein
MKRVVEVSADLNVLIGDPAVAASVKREAFFTTGMELVEAGGCPFCDTPWDLGELKKYVQAKLDHLKEVSRKRRTAETKIAPLIVTLRKVQAAINTVVGYAALATPPLALKAAHEYGVHCRTAIERLNALLPLAETITVLANVPIIPQIILDEIREFDQVVAALPEPTKQDAAREWLVVAEERLENWRDAMRKHKIAKDQALRFLRGSMQTWKRTSRRFTAS